MAWAINRWFELYDDYEARKIKGPMTWVKFPADFSGRDFSDLGKTAEGRQAFSIFVLLVEIAAKRPKEQRNGILEKNGKAFDAEHMGRVTGWPPECFQVAFPILESAGWITDKSLEQPDAPRGFQDVRRMRPGDSRMATGRPPDGVLESPDAPRIASWDSRYTGPDRTGPDRTGPDRGRSVEIRESPDTIRESPDENRADGGRTGTTKNLAEEIRRGADRKAVTDRPTEPNELEGKREGFQLMAAAMKGFADWVCRRNWPFPDQPMVMKCLATVEGVPVENWTSQLQVEALALRPRGSDTSFDMRNYALVLKILKRCFKPNAGEE